MYDVKKLFGRCMLLSREQMSGPTRLREDIINGRRGNITGRRNFRALNVRLKDKLRVEKRRNIRGIQGDLISQVDGSGLLT